MYGYDTRNIFLILNSIKYVEYTHIFLTELNSSLKSSSPPPSVFRGIRSKDRSTPTFPSRSDPIALFLFEQQLNCIAEPEMRFYLLKTDLKICLFPSR